MSPDVFEILNLDARLILYRWTCLPWPHWGWKKVAFKQESGYGFLTASILKRLKFLSNFGDWVNPKELVLQQPVTIQFCTTTKNPLSSLNPPLPLHSQISLSSNKSLVSNGLEITQVTAGSFIEELWYVLIREYYSDESVLIIN